MPINDSNIHVMYSYTTHINHLTAGWKQNDMKKRKSTRFRTQDNAFAALRGQQTKVGKIFDISLSGLAFRYLTEEKSTEAYNKADIFLSRNGFHLPDVSCTIVYDVDVKEFMDGSYGIRAYRCGLMFDPLEGEAKERLEYFLNNHTIGEL